MSKKRYQIAVIGCGAIWDIGHIGGIREIPDDVQVKYVYDTDETLADKAATEIGATRVDDTDRIFEDDAIDIVAVLTPPTPRPEYVRKACAAGKHLLLEKPMARTVDDALDIFNTIRSSGVKCFIPFMRALSFATRELARELQAGTFGEPLSYVHTCLAVPYPWIPLEHWMHDQDQSGGPLFDFSIHFIEAARALIGAEAKTVTYGGAATTGRVKSHDHATLVINYEGGRLGQYTKSWSFPPGVECDHIMTHIVCRDAVIVLAGWGAKVEVHRPVGVSEFTADKPEHGGRADSYLNLIAAIEDGVKPHADELDGLRMNEILDAMERSRASGATEDVVLHD